MAQRLSATKMSLPYNRPVFSIQVKYLYRHRLRYILDIHIQIKAIVFRYLDFFSLQNHFNVYM